MFQMFRTPPFLTCLILTALAVRAPGQNFNGGFSFLLPPTDTVAARFFPSFPRSAITDQDRVSIGPEGHFAVGGTPFRFFGVNVTAEAAFPQPSRVWSIAGRLRKMGFNVVRLHHLDNPWSAGSLFERGTSTRQLNPVTLERLEALVAGLKSNGIYVDVNLHCSRTFNALDGLPDADSLQDFGKAINYFDPAVLALHKEFARQLLTHVNPHTGKALATDPVMALVELTNENSLYRYWREGRLTPIAQGGILTARHVRMLDSAWNDYLEGLYQSTAALSEVWNVGAQPPLVIGLLPDETLEAGSVRRITYASCPGFTDGRVSDMSAFIIGLEDRYYAALRSYLRDSLGVRAPIMGTSFNIGPADIAAQSKQDYIDHHSYWDHPMFPGVLWSPTDWAIANTPMVREQNGATIGHLFAGTPVSGKPFTVSEYNQTFPNRYQSEAPLFLSAYGAFHGADGLMFFDYNATDDWETDVVANFFSIHRNPAMMALIPSCAAAFRLGLIAPARQRIILDYAPADYLTLPRRDTSGWLGVSLVDRTLALKHGVRTGNMSSPVPFDPAALPPPPVNPFVTDTREIVWDAAGLLGIITPKFIGVAGFLDAYAGWSAGPFRLSGANGFASLTWLSLTPDSLVSSRLSLLTVSTMAQNSGMVWDGTTTVHDRWGGPPTRVAPLLLSVELMVRADSIRVYPLDSTGVETRGFTTYHPTGSGVFAPVFDLEQSRTLWFGIEAFGDGLTTELESFAGDLPRATRLTRNYPNPFNPSTVIGYQVGAASDVVVTVHDLLGRVVTTLVRGRVEPGRYSVLWNAAGLAGGVYIVRLQAGQTTSTERLIFLK